MKNEQREAIDILKEITEKDLLNYWEGPEKPYNAIQIVLSLIKEQQEEIEKDKELKQRLCKEVNQVYEEGEKKDKQIDLMAESIELQQYANIDTSNLDLVCEKLKCNKKCELVKKDCIKQYFAGLVEKE